MKYARIQSPIGTLLITGDESGLCHIGFGEGKHILHPADDWSESGCVILDETEKQLAEYFNGKRTRFDLALNPAGTTFQKEVWRELQQIPYGTTISYGELAKRVGRPKASRAVGAANGANPIPIVIPCHRVIGCDGSMTGYAGGLRIKTSLLRLEGFPLGESRQPMLRGIEASRKAAGESY